MNQELAINRKEDNFNAMPEGLWSGQEGWRHKVRKSLACLVNDGGFGGGFLKVVTAELRLTNADESPKKSGQGKIRSLPEGRRHGVERYSHRSWTAFSIPRVSVEVTHHSKCPLLSCKLRTALCH